MHTTSCGGLTFINADIGGGEISTLCILGSRIAAVGDAPHAGELVVDLHGDRLLPGLINAHDHLQLNSLPRLEHRTHYRHARDWIAQVDGQRHLDEQFKASVAVSCNDRLLLGGIKNLLSGVTTVAHHDPLYPALLDPAYPTRIVTDCGWSHSLYIDGEQRVRSSYRYTPSVWPWIIHAAEGLDEDAKHEFERLDALGCLAPNTLIVHGIALDHAQRRRIELAGAGLIWCPSSNLHLFGQTAAVADLIARGRVTLGTDSRLSGARDLLDELRIARAVTGLDAPTLESLVTGDAARLLRLSDRGVLKVGARADIVIVPAGMPLTRTTRADVRLVMLDGVARYGDQEYALITGPTLHWRDIRVDGRPKFLDGNLAARLSDAAVTEDGLELPTVTWRAA